MVRQRIANPCNPVRFRTAPPPSSCRLSPMRARYQTIAVVGAASCHLTEHRSTSRLLGDQGGPEGGPSPDPRPGGPSCGAAPAGIMLRLPPCSASEHSCLLVRVLDIARDCEPGARSDHLACGDAVLTGSIRAPHTASRDSVGGGGLGCELRLHPHQSTPPRQPHAAHRRTRFASSLASRASWRAASNLPGICSPPPMYISSGVCPLNAECGTRSLCSAT